MKYSFLIIMTMFALACGEKPRSPSDVSTPTKLPTKTGENDDDTSPTKTKTKRQPQGNLDEPARNLLRHQNEKFPEILKELTTHNKKVSDWIWWVFPTEKPGDNEPSPKSSVTLNQVENVLANADVNQWSQILEKMADLLEKNPVGTDPLQPNSTIIPSIDFGRIKFALSLWLDQAGSTSRKYPRFYNAMTRFKKYRW